ncbi:MAG: hypothetical protein JXA90_12280 [Planctomycetes bacterium]|nr:hypothetical protein [Planctomycetota bacterium]
MTMRESPKRFFFAFCAILGLLLAAISAGGWLTCRELELRRDGPAGPASKTVAGRMGAE